MDPGTGIVYTFICIHLRFHIFICIQIYIKPWLHRLYMCYKRYFVCAYICMYACYAQMYEWYGNIENRQLLSILLALKKVCVCVCVCVCTHTHTYTHTITYAYTYIHTYTHEHEYNGFAGAAFTFFLLWPLMHSCTRPPVVQYWRNSSVCACVRTYIHTYVHTYIHTYMLFSGVW